jgi:hypothetical protein
MIFTTAQEVAQGVFMDIGTFNKQGEAEMSPFFCIKKT